MDLNAEDWYIGSNVPAAGLAVKKKITEEELLKVIKEEGDDNNNDE